MGIWNKIKNSVTRTITKEKYAWWIDSSNSISGVSVTDQSALTYNPWFAGVTYLADSTSMLPLPILQSTDTGKKRIYTHAANKLLNWTANPYQSAYTFRNLMTFWAVHKGNAYAEIERDTDGNPVALWPLPPECVTPKLVNLQNAPDTLYPEGRNVAIAVYDIKTVDGVTTLSANNVLHIMGTTSNGIEGLDPIKLFKETLGAGLAAERYANTFWANGSRPDGVIQMDGDIDDEDAKNYVKNWEKTYGGLSNAHRVGLLKLGAKFVSLATDNQSSQFLETRQFSVLDVCRILRLKPHMLGDMSKASYASIEQQGMDFVTYTLSPWLKRWESEANRKLFSFAERQAGLFVEHNTDALLRGDTSSRYAAYAIGRQWGWLSQNDIRRKENMDDIAGGDTYLSPLNMTPTNKPQDPARAFNPLLADVLGRIDRRTTKSGQADPEFAYQTLRPAVEAMAAISGKVVVETELRAFISKNMSQGGVGNTGYIEGLCNQLISKWGTSE